MTAEADDTHPPGHAKRNVPALPIKILDGCSRGSVALIVKSIGEAIEIGAPLYNDGNFAGCYHVYDGAAGDLERKLVLESSCQKPAKALAEGRRKASHLASASDQAWAMRDTFDGLVEVIKRKEASAEPVPCDDTRAHPARDANLFDDPHRRRRFGDLHHEREGHSRA